MLRTAALLCALAAFGGCGNGVGENGAVVGGSCLTSAECDNRSQCLTGANYPSGYCAKACTTDTCPTGTDCVDPPDYMAMCLLVCAADSDCRDGYACVDLPAHSGAGTSKVCAVMP